MKTIKVSALLILFILTANLALSQNNVIKEAKATYNQILQLFNSGDYEGYGHYVADNIECYTGVYTPLLWKGKSNWMDFIKGLNNFSLVKYDFRQPSYRNFGETTVMCNGYFVFTTVDKQGVTEIQSGRQSTLLIKQDGIWKIASNHFSAMF
ncbi:nuclear transport factor 2 family protein [Aestuariivivens insulae]|uniref:nuclear transport factor 2 family protein n=1 Tax=Aestuariivivens insulae TaxID=1621988 RepID=UPI001F599C28|nr:nuclear transport factor 2 family protein [Aestuariivivens insulae]